MKVVSGYDPPVGCELLEKFLKKMDERIQVIPRMQRMMIEADCNVDEENKSDVEVMEKYGVKVKNAKDFG